MKRFNEKAFLEDAASICWGQIASQCTEIDIVAQEWSNAFSSVIEKHAPMKTISASEKYCPWVNDLKRMIRSRDKLKKKAIKTGSPFLLSSYKHLRNQVNRFNIDLKRKYFTESIQNSEGNSKETWNALNQLMNKKSKTTNINYVKQEGNVISNKKAISDTMNQLFCSIGTTPAEEIEDSPNPLLSGKYHLNPKSSSFKFSPLLVRDVREAINKVKTSKGYGTDGISNYFLKLALPFIEHSFVLMFNMFLGTASFPDSWKTARVMPIFKDGEKDEKSNYRPISILPVVSKLFKRTVFSQLYQYLNRNSLIYKSQSGFRELFSTISCLLFNVGDWYKRIDTGHYIGFVFIDFKKPFYTVDQSILCEKLIHSGIQHREIEWFMFYLSNRRQFCRIGGVDSEINYV